MITLYDFDTRLPGRCMSPFVWRVRFALNIKGIQHKTEWLNFAKLEEQLKERNVAPSKIAPDGTGFYSVPAIYDPSTNAVVSDSHRIIQYLDETYPDTPQLLACPAALADDELVKPAFEPNWHLPISLMFHGIWGLVVPSVVKGMTDEACSVKYREKFELRTGIKFESVQEEERKRELLEKGRRNFGEVGGELAKLRGKYGGQGPWALGKDVQMPDIAIAGSLSWMASILGEESEPWKEIMTWDAGSWAKIWGGAKPWHQLH